ncbi:response regulator [Flavobacterium sp.]|uniref:response regulator n=1 Tax=Flavobacterium sp. TaxID=239 RepID=UPI003C46733E
MNEINIFYADDDEDDLMFFYDAVENVSKITQKFISLHIHKNGENLLNSIKDNISKKGVVFLDINMPKKSGFDFLKEIRNELCTYQIPVIIYSTSSNKSDIELSYSLGANYFVIKPYKFNDLIKMIHKIIEINWDNNPMDMNNFVLIK